MRITGGHFRSRPLRAPVGPHTRPTSDRVREALFSALNARRPFAGLRVLDLFAGTGALGLEALSRGADFAVFVEHDRAALRCLEHNVAQLELGDRVRIVRGDVARVARQVLHDFEPDLVLVDPPYAQVRELPKTLRDYRTVSATWVIEHASRDPAPQLVCAQLHSSRPYGDTTVSLYEPGYSERGPDE